jgi:2-polyprenyl-6-methoxyphenol hydroxylase-like FAD-dependent oxidoreductase
MSNDVVIAGGGPNGLLLACELKLAGVDPIVLERLSQPSDMPKANGLVGQVVRMLDYRGLYERFSGNSSAPRAVPSFQFGGLGLELHRLADNPMFMLPIPQRRLEQLLEERATELGVEIRRGHEVTGLTQNDESVTLRVHDGTGDYELTARYVVGCDGGHSLIRRSVGIGFPGITDTRFVSRTGTVTLPDAYNVVGSGEIELPGKRRLAPFVFHRMPQGIFVFGTFQPGVYRISVLEWDQPDVGPEGPLPIAELREAALRVLGADLPMTPAEIAGGDGLRRRPGVNSRQADRYREGRVFLVGDAAHVHSGVGGPGLNLGLQDGINLGWKLAAEVGGWAPPGLLDSYQSERFPLGERVLMHTRAQMELLAPGENITALRRLFAEMLSDDTNLRRIAELMTGAEARYDTFADQLPEHELIGRFVPDLPLDPSPTRVGELLRVARPVLLDLTGNALAETVTGWQGRVEVVSAGTTRPAPADAILIRPDGYVAWAVGPGTAAEEVRRSALAALRTWLGDQPAK